MRNIADLPGHLRLRALGPVAAVPLREALRAGLGAAIGLAVTAGLALLLSPERWLVIYLVAPFGATAVLIFAAPNSPLAQPWPAIVGNATSALAAIAACKMVSEPLLSIPLAVAMAIMAMALLRATHPPGGAVAMTVALGAESILPYGFGFALMPVAAGTLALVLTGILYARLTGRRYPLRQFGEVNPNGTLDPVATERLGLSEEELSGILSRYRQSLNLGVEDLARLIAAAEMQAAGHLDGPQQVGDIMSRDLVTVSPDMPADRVAELFMRHGFTSLPVVGRDDQFLGVIFQLHMIGAAFGKERPVEGSLLRQIRARLRAPKGNGMVASAIMDVAPVATTPQTPIAAVLPQLATSGMDAVPVLEGSRIVGVVTQTDLIAALARQSLRDK